MLADLGRKLKESAATRYALGALRAPAPLLEAGESLPVDADGLASFDLVVAGGRIEAVAPAGSVPDALPGGGRLVLPCFADVHTHLDMDHQVDEWPNAQGTLMGALAARAAYTSAALARGAAWLERDIERRLDFGLRCSHAHGTAAARTHLDSRPEVAGATWRAFARARAHWRGRLELQGVSLLPIDGYSGGQGPALADLVSESGGILGGVTRVLPGGDGDARLREALETLFRLAAERGLDVDLHVDETLDPAARSLDAVARAKLATGFKGTVVCGHCCSLSVRPEEEARAAIALCREAGLNVVSLPHLNLFLQDRSAGRTPRRRGITLLHELRAAGVPVALGTDDVRNSFYAYGDHDLLAVLAHAALIGHLDYALGDWPAAITRVPAGMMGLDDAGRLEAGLPADFVLFSARRYSELLSRPQSDRIVVRGGRPSEAPLPDYSELDP